MVSVIISGGLALAVLGGLGLLLFDAPEPGGLSGVTVGGGAAVIMAAIAALPGHRMPDWAIGVRGDRLSRGVNTTPLVALGWAIAAAAGLGTLTEAGPAEAAYAMLVAAIAPVALGRSLSGFLASARRFRAWGEVRGLSYSPEVDPPESTPLLRSGSYRYAVNCLRGNLDDHPGALVCQLGVVTVEDSGGEVSAMSTRRFTVLALAAPDVTGRLPVLVCAPRSPVPGYDAIKAYGRKLERVNLESSDFEARWDLAIERGGDQSWLRRLFEPTFIETLAVADPGWGWELEAGLLVVYEPGWRERGTDLDRLGARVAPIIARIDDEFEETPALA